MLASTLVTVILFTYNQEKFVRDSVRSILNQTYSPLEIIISDDCSSDRTFEILKEEVGCYGGPHKVILRRNGKNIGLIGHFNKLILEIASGDFIVAAAGDDISDAHRVEILVEAWRNFGVSAVASNVMVIDSEGNEMQLLWPYEILDKRKLVRFEDVLKRGIREIASAGAALSFDMSVFKTFGPLPMNVVNEDWIIPFRASLLNGVYFIGKPLVKYRLHGENNNFKINFNGGIKGADNSLWLKTRKAKVKNMIGNFEGFIAALKKRDDAYPVSDVNIVLSKFNRKVKIYRFEEEMLKEGLIKRFYFFAKGMHGGVDFKSFIKLFILALSPYLYAAVLRKLKRT